MTDGNEPCSGSSASSGSVLKADDSISTLYEIDTLNELACYLTVLLKIPEETAQAEHNDAGTYEDILYERQNTSEDFKEHDWMMKQGRWLYSLTKDTMSRQNANTESIVQLVELLAETVLNDEIHWKEQGTDRARICRKMFEQLLKSLHTYKIYDSDHSPANSSFVSDDVSLRPPSPMSLNSSGDVPYSPSTASPNDDGSGPCQDAV